MFVAELERVTDSPAEPRT